MTQLPDHHQDVGPGWTPLLGRLHEKLLAVEQHYQVTQVKEKFGGLRVYLVREPAEAYALIEEAMVEADHTCEECGSQDDITNEGPGWMKTLCPACRQARADRRLRDWGL